MPANVVKSMSHQTGKPVSEVEKHWDSAKAAADKKFNGVRDDHYWAYVNSTAHKSMGLHGNPKK